MSKQLLSAAVDAAATEAEWDALLLALEQDPEITAEWSRIWEWRDVRDGVTLKGDGNFCGGVMAAIAAEQPLPSNVVEFSRRPAAAPAVAAQPAARRNWRTLVPLSAAAGVVAAVLVVGGLRGTGGENGQPVVVAANSAPAVAVALQADAADSAMLADDAKAAILNAYLMEHSNSLADRSMGGTLANARFAARTATYRPDSP